MLRFSGVPCSRAVPELEEPARQRSLLGQCRSIETAQYLAELPTQGPEIDIWTIGVTLLRCLTGHKYPLGVSHTSLQHLADKTTDSLLSIPHKDFRRVLAGLLDMDGDARISTFKALPADIDQYPYTTNTHVPAEEREFKNTTFIPARPKHVLQLQIISPGMMSPASDMPSLNATSSGLVKAQSRSQSRDRLAAHFAAGLELTDENFRVTGRSGYVSPPRLQTSLGSNELLLLNPTHEPATRAISFIKYALRCAGTLYHVQGVSDREEQPNLSQDLPQAEPPRLKRSSPVLHCVQMLPKEAPHPHSAAANHLMSIKLRPSLTRAQTAAASAGRSPSAPPASLSKAKKSSSKASEQAKVRCLEFWIQIIPVYVGGGSTDSRRTSPKVDKTQRRNRSRSRTRNGDDVRRCTKLRIRVSDEAALPFVSKALDVTEVENTQTDAEGGGPPVKHVSGPDRMEGKGRKKVVVTADPEEEQARGRPKLSRSASSGEHEMAARRDIAALLSPRQQKSRPQLSRAFTDAPNSAESSELPGIRGERSPISDPDSCASPITPLAGLAPLLPAPTRSKSSRGFFDLVGFGRPRATAAPYTAASTPMPMDESCSADSRPVTPGPMAFAAL